MATINYWGLSKKGSVTTALTVTVDQLITAIAADEGLSTEYYTVSNLTNPSKNSITYGDSSTTLTQMGYVDGTTVLCTTNQFGSKQERQAEKLAIASKKRSLTGRNQYLDITMLPTQYSGNNSVTDNANASGLVAGRPWLSAPPYSAGLYRTQYSFWPNQNTANPTWFAGANTAGSAVATDFEMTLTAGQISRAYQWLGYFLPDVTGTWTFSTQGVTIDDCMIIWVGDNAITGFTTGNSLANISLIAGSATISLTAGTYYPIRVQYANNSGPGTNTLYYNNTVNTTPSKVWTGKLFYNPATNGF